MIVFLCFFDVADIPIPNPHIVKIPKTSNIIIQSHAIKKPPLIRTHSHNTQISQSSPMIKIHSHFINAKNLFKSSKSLERKPRLNRLNPNSKYNPPSSHPKIKKWQQPSIKHFNRIKYNRKFIFKEPGLI